MPSIRSGLPAGAIATFAIKDAALRPLMWLVVMLVVMPLAGAGVFASHQSTMAPVAILALYLIYELILSGIYSSNLDALNSQRIPRLA